MSESAPIEHPTWLTTGDFTEADEPLRLFAAWFEEAVRGEPRDPTAMSLATVDADGMPNVRMVLMKGFDERGFVFYTNIDSQKGRELDRSSQGALLFHWKSLNRQVRLRGPVERIDDGEADAISRPVRASRRSAPGPASSRRRSRAAMPSRRRSRSTRRNSRSERSRARRTGPATVCVPLAIEFWHERPVPAARPDRISPRGALARRGARRGSIRSPRKRAFARAIRVSPRAAAHALRHSPSKT